MERNSSRDIRQLYKISSAGPSIKLGDDDILLEKCYHIDSGSEYSLRTFRKSTTRLDRCCRNMIKELIELDHPNIIKIYDFFENDDCIQTVFQKCEGTTLFLELQRMPGYRFDELSSSRMISQILSSVRYLQRKHLLLGEISLENILIHTSSSGYDLKITDFCLRSPTLTNSYLQEKSIEVHDLFFIGLIAFSLVTGIRLLVETRNETEFSCTLQNREEFHSLSSDCKSFIIACVSNCSTCSINADSLQQHPWLLKNSVVNTISPDTIGKLKDYKQKSLIERILIFAVSQSLSTLQLEDIKQEFLKFDKNSGEITYTDFREALKNISEEEIKQIFSAINISRSNTISYHEFICPLMTERNVSERNIKSTFLQLCCSNQDYLLLTDLKDILNGECNMEYNLTMFNEDELSADAFLSYNQFKKCIGFYCDESSVRANLVSPPTKSPHANKRKEIYIPSTLPVITSNKIAKDIIASHRRLQSMTENMVTENVHIDVLSIYTVDNSDIMGTGASSKVYKCRHKITGVNYAMKSIDITNKSKTKIDMLRQEIRIMAKLDHPNILRLHESYETNTAIYLILDLCTGGELLENLNDQPSHRYSEDVACKLIFDILRAIRYCHEQGITHRDLKLENFLFDSKTENASIKLIDFGLSCYFSNRQYLKKFIGTPYYLAPEVLKEHYNEKADIWSIGIIAYMLTTGSPLFHGDNDYEIMHAIGEGQVEYCSRFRKISSSGQDFINNCLIRNPNDRPSAQEAQSHPWFRCLQRKLPTISPRIYSNLQQFFTRRPLSRLFMFVLAHTQRDEFLVDVRQAFIAINTSNSGEINYDEMRVALLGNFNVKDISRLISMIDIECTGKIKYHQFIAATFTLTDLRERLWKMAFYKISNHNESFTIMDVERLLGKNATAKEMEVLLLDWNKSTSTSITFTDFINIVNGVYDTEEKAVNESIISTTTSISTNTNNNNTINKGISMDSYDMSSTVIVRPPSRYSISKPFRRNFVLSSLFQPSHLLSSTTTTITPPENINNNNNIPKRPDDFLLKSTQQIDTNTVQNDNNYPYQLNDHNNLSPLNTNASSSLCGNNNSTISKQTSFKIETVIPSSFTRTMMASITSKFRSADDLTSLPIIHTNKISSSRGSLGSRTQSSK